MPGSNCYSHTILVTGAAGFIGHAVCKELISNRYRVLAIIRSSNPFEYDDWGNNEMLRIERIDICDTEALSQLISDNNVTSILHLAAHLPSINDFTNPFLSFNDNAYGTLSLLDSAYKNGVEKFVYSSTIDVYKEPPNYLPVDEDHPTLPETHYGAGKLAGELFSNLYNQKMKITILRYGIVYGLEGKPNGAVNRFICAAKANKPLTVYGGGTQSNDFICVKDAVKANLLALQEDKPGIYNIGCGEQTTINYLAATIIELTGSQSKIENVDFVSNRPFQFYLNIFKAKNILGFHPTPLRTGLSEYIQELRED